MTLALSLFLDYAQGTFLRTNPKLGAEAHSTGVIPVIHLNLSHGGEAQKSWGLGIHH